MKSAVATSINTSSTATNRIEKNINAQKRMTEREYNYLIRKEQIKVYLITYLSYSIIHFQREFWSLAKTYITKKFPKELSKATLSRFDTAQLFVYALFLYICGAVGDIYD